jgi:uncharacterized protein (TIGR04255 family)
LHDEVSHARERHLSRAPITEAVIEIRVELTRRLGTADFDTLRQTFEAEFETVVEQREIEALLRFDVGTGPDQQAIDQGVRRLLFRSDTRNDILIVGEGRFAYVKLRPYSSFERIRSRAQELWTRYSEVVPVEHATRLGLRYINQFGIPAHRSFTDFLTVPVQSPETVLTDNVTKEFSQLDLTDRLVGISARFVRVVESLNGTAEVIIDTDAFREGRLPFGANVWERFEELRQMKNRMFFGSITETAAQEWE